jgi:ribosomal protein S6E (S10)
LCGRCARRGECRSSADRQLNIANPATGAQKLIDIEDERKVRIFYDKQMSQEVAVGALRARQGTRRRSRLGRTKDWR